MISNLVVEAMVVAFCAGGVVGALLVIYYQGPVKRAQARVARQRINR